VLSVCQTGLGKEIKGEGLVGLTRGFMYAGRPRVIVSLWSVDDVATSEMMADFYRGLLQTSAGRHPITGPRSGCKANAVNTKAERQINRRSASLRAHQGDPLNSRTGRLPLPPVADQHKWRPIEWRAVFLSRDHCQLSIPHRAGGRGTCGRGDRRSQQALVEIGHQVRG